MMKRITVNMTLSTQAALEALTERDDITATEAVRRALALSEWVGRERRMGGRLILRSANGTEREVIVL